MIKIRPVSELRNSFPKIEDLVINQNEIVYLTKNGTGIMVVMSIEKYSELVQNSEENSIAPSNKISRRKTSNKTSNSINSVIDENDVTINDINTLWNSEDDI